MEDRIVKIVRNGERFWINEVAPHEGRLIGKVNNHLITEENSDLVFGSSVVFDEDEIIDEFVDTNAKTN